MLFILAALPILTILFLMLVMHWSTPRAGLAGWLLAVLAGILAFGLTFQVFWVSQAKGLLLSLYVLVILWPALYLYQVIQQINGIDALANKLERIIGDRGVLLILLAWAFSGMLEGLAGFGIPVAIVAPMLVGLGATPITAVAAVAVGHAWAVTFGDMGVIFQTLVGVTQMDPAALVPAAGILLGCACLACGLACAFLLGHLKHWPIVILISILMAGVQYALAMVKLIPLAGLGAGAAGVLGGMILGVLKKKTPNGEADPTPGRENLPVTIDHGLVSTISSYGVLAAVMCMLALPGPIRDGLYPVVWQQVFPQVITRTGFLVPSGSGQVFRLFLHPGTAILFVAIASVFTYQRLGYCDRDSWKRAGKATTRIAAPISLGIIATVGLAALMDHTGMTLLLAKGLSLVMGSAYPFISPWVGILGAFATGSNNNSNVLFGMLQKNAAILVGVAPALLVAAQTAGGSLGSMIAPAKIVVGCSTAGILGKEGEVLKKTLPYGLGIGLLVGLIAYLINIVS